MGKELKDNNDSIKQAQGYMMGVYSNDIIKQAEFDFF